MKDLPPGPYTYETTAPEGRPDGHGHVYIVDAKGKRIASIWGKPCAKMALVELIVKASEVVR